MKYEAMGQSMPWISKVTSSSQPSAVGLSQRHAGGERQGSGKICHVHAPRNFDGAPDSKEGVIVPE